MIQVYTANVGEHDPSRAEENGLTVFTEDVMNNPLLAARRYKCQPHIYFPKAEWTIWIDANVFLKKPPEFFVEMCEDRTYGAFAHFHRSNAFEEARAVVDAGMDKASNVERALSYYIQPSKHLAQTFILVRKNTYENAIRNLNWWRTLCWSSPRDQLTFELYYPGPYWPTVDFTKPNEFFERVSK